MTAPPNSEIAYAPDTTAPFDFETAATYRCSNGFGLSGGDRVRTCLSGTLEGGVWSGVSATCDSEKTQTINPSNYSALIHVGLLIVVLYISASVFYWDGNGLCYLLGSSQLVYRRNVCVSILKSAVIMYNYYVSAL